ncbi:unnamed protein product, partial [Owenia fusiformis]
ADATEMFENAGVKILTDAYIHKEQDDYHMFRDNAPVMAMDGGARPLLPNPILRNKSAKKLPAIPENSESAVEPPHIRTVFPDTWIWLSNQTGYEKCSVVCYLCPLGLC